MAARMEVTARPFASRYPPNPLPCAAAAMATATAIQSSGVHGASLADDLGGRGGLRDWVAPPAAMPPSSGSAAAATGEFGDTMGALVGVEAGDATVVPPTDLGIEGQGVVHSSTFSAQFNLLSSTSTAVVDQ